MRGRGIYAYWRALPRMSWHPKNLYNLWARTGRPEFPSEGNKTAEIVFRNTGSKTLFQLRWQAKMIVRAYHGDYIPEKRFKRWFLPDNLPDVRPKRHVALNDDKAALEDFAQRRIRDREAKMEKEVAEKGLPPVGSMMFSELERRLDIFLFRCCFVHSVYEARRLIVHGEVSLNGKRHIKSSTRLAPGDMISVNPSAMRFFMPQEKTGYLTVRNDLTDGKNLTPFALPPYASPWIFIPAYAEVSFPTCSAIYVRHPTARPGYSEIPTPFDPDGPLLRYAWEWYVKRRPRMRSHAQRSRAPEDRALAKMEDINEGRRHLRLDMARMVAATRHARKIEKKRR